MSYLTLSNQGSKSYIGGAYKLVSFNTNMFFCCSFVWKNY